MKKPGNLTGRYCQKFLSSALQRQKSPEGGPGRVGALLLFRMVSARNSEPLSRLIRDFTKGNNGQMTVVGARFGGGGMAASGQLLDQIKELSAPIPESRGGWKFVQFNRRCVGFLRGDANWLT